MAAWSALSTPADAARRAAGDPVQVTAGWAGLSRPGRLLPVQVSLSGAAAASPTVDVRVQSGNGGTTITRTKVTRSADGVGRATVAVSAPRDLGTFEVAVSAQHGGTTDQGKATVNPVGDEELVGVLPGLARQSPPPETEPLTVPIGTARFVTVDPATLRVVGTLQPLGTLAATADELARLDKDQQLNVLTWLASGGRLLVDAKDGPVAGLPAAWQPTAAEPRVNAALGEVRLTGGQLAAGKWQGEIEPTPTVGPSDPDIVSPSFAGGEVGQAIAKDSGLRIPSLGSVLAFLLGYILLAGPITFFILHKLHRAELAWVIVPLLAIGFTVGGWWIGGNARDNTRTAFSASVFETQGVDLDQSFVGVLSRQGGDRSVSFPGSWWGGNVANELYGRPEAEVTTTVGVRTISTVSLVGGEFAVLGGRGPAQPSSQLVIDARSADDGSVGGAVRNTTRRTLHQTAVFVGNRSVLVGDLLPGASKPFSVASPDLSGSNKDLQAIYGAPEAKVWPSVATQTVDQRTGPVDLALWGETTRQLGPDLRSPGSAVAVGWADNLDPTGVLGTSAEGRTAIVARSTVVPGAKLTGMDVRRDLLRGPTRTRVSDGSGPAAGAVFRFVIPAGSTVKADDLQISVPVTLSQVEVWDGTRWVTIHGSAGTANGSDPGAVTPSFEGPPSLVDLPAVADQDGVIYVRVAVQFNGPSNSTGELLVSQR